MAERSGANRRTCGRWAAVLCVRDAEDAAALLARQIGFVPDNDDPTLLRFGGQALRLVAPTDRPAGLIHLPFDHLALSVPDLDAALAGSLGRGGVLDRAFTPDGPREIAEFWEAGVRYAFLSGPDGAPIEFCSRLGGACREVGHDHFGIRVVDFAATEARLYALGGRLLAEHRLGGGGRLVSVRFWRLDNMLFELFDEPSQAPSAVGDAAGQWIGWLPAQVFA